MALDSLQRVIEKLQKTIEAHRSYLAENETRTRQVLIDQLLRELGWDVSDPDAVQLEYWVKQQRADYALMSNGKPLAVIEAKRLGSDLTDDQIMQALNYANAGGIPYVIITNGDTWEMYEVFKPAELEDRRLMRFQLSQQPAYKNALQALAMWRPNLASDGAPSAATEPLLVSPESALDQTSVKPDGQQQQQFSNDLPADFEKCYSFISERRYPPNTTPIPNRLKIGTHIEKQVDSWWDVIHEVVVWLVNERILSSNNCPIEMGEWTFINSEAVNRDGTPFRNPRELPNGLILQRGRGTTREQWERLWKLLKQFNIDLSKIEVFYKLIEKASS